MEESASGGFNYADAFTWFAWFVADVCACDFFVFDKFNCALSCVKKFNKSCPVECQGAMNGFIPSVVNIARILPAPTGLPFLLKRLVCQVDQRGKYRCLRLELLLRADLSLGKEICCEVHSSTCSPI